MFGAASAVDGICIEAREGDREDAEAEGGAGDGVLLASSSFSPRIMHGDRHFSAGDAKVAMPQGASHRSKL